MPETAWRRLGLPLAVLASLRAHASGNRLPVAAACLPACRCAHAYSSGTWEPSLSPHAELHTVNAPTHLCNEPTVGAFHPVAHWASSRGLRSSVQCWQKWHSKLELEMPRNVSRVWEAECCATLVTCLLRFDRWYEGALKVVVRRPLFSGPHTHHICYRVQYMLTTR